MAITAATRTDIIELVVLATGGAPGTTLLGDLVNTYESTGSLAGVAAALTSSASFKTKYPSFQTADEFGAEFLDSILPGLDAAVKAEGVAAISAVLNGGGSRADVLVQAAAFLSTLDTADAAFGSSAALFQNQVTVAEYHTVELELDTGLTDAIANVTSDSTTVDSSKGTLDGTGASAVAYNEAQAAADAAITAATEAAAPVADVVAAYEAAAATAAETDAAALKATSDASAAAAATAAAAKETADAAVVTAQAALDAAIQAGDANAVSTANGELIIAQSAAATAATNAETTAATAATDLAAYEAAAAADAAAAEAAAAVNTLGATIAASTAGADAVAAAAAAAAAADAYAADAAKTSTTTDDTASAAAQAAAAASVAAAADAAAAFDAASSSISTAVTAIAQAGLEATAAEALTAYNTAAATAAASLAAAETAKTASDAAATAANASDATITEANAYVTAAAALTTAAATAAADAAAEKTAADALKAATDATTTTTDDAAATSAVSTATSNVDAAAALVTAGSTADSAAAALLPTFEAQSFTLTSAVNNFTGGKGNDTFIADDTQTTKVTSAADVLTGGAGDDSLTIYGTPNAIPQITGIENIELDSMANGATPSLASVSGIETLTVDRSAGTAAVTVGTGVTVVLSNSSANTQTVNYAASATSGNLTLNNITTAVTETGAALATLNIATTGAKSTVSTLTTGGTVTKLVITGDQDLTVTADLNAAIKTVDASAATGKVNVDAGNIADGTGTDFTFTGGSGNDTIDVTTADATDEVALSGGAGDDIFITAGEIDSTSDSIDGGDGTDTWKVGGNIAAVDLSTKVINIETIEFTADAGGTAMATNKINVSNFVLGDDIDLTITGLAASSTFELNGAGTNDATDLAATIGTNTSADVINVNLSSTGATNETNVTVTNYETLNVVSTKSAADASTVTNTAAITGATVTTLNISGTQKLTSSAIAIKAAGAINASDMSGDLTITSVTNSLKTYTGGSGKDTVTVKAGDLKQGNSYDGGTGTDALSVTASASQDLGIVGLTGFETLNLVLSGTNVADFRNVTGLSTIKVEQSATTDDLTLNRYDASATLSFGESMDEIVTTIQSGTTQNVGFYAAATIDNLTLDSGTTVLNIASDDGDTTAEEAMGVFTNAPSGTSLTTINVTGKDDLNIGTLTSTVTTFDASASTGNITVTASATGTTLKGGSKDDTITGGAGADTITAGDGDDTLVGAGGADKFIFEASGTANGTDTIVFVVADDDLNMSAFGTFTIGQNGGSGTAITPYAIGATSDVNITDKIVLLDDADADDGDVGVDTAAEIAALIDGAGDVFSITAGGKAIVIGGNATITDTTSNDTYAHVYYVNDANGDGDVSDTGEVAKVGILTGSTDDFDLDTLTTNNFLLS